MNKERLLTLNKLCTEMIRLDDRIFIGKIFSGGTVHQETIDLHRKMVIFYEILMKEVMDEWCNIEVHRDRVTNDISIEYNETDPKEFGYNTTKRIMLYSPDDEIFRTANRKILGDDN